MRQVAKLVVEFWPKEPGVYPCTVTLTSDVDIRIYQFEGMAGMACHGISGYFVGILFGDPEAFGMKFPPSLDDFLRNF